MEKMRHTAMTRASDFFDRRSRIVVTWTAARENTSSHRDVVSLPSADWFLEWSALGEFRDLDEAFRDACSRGEGRGQKKKDNK